MQTIYNDGDDFIKKMKGMQFYFGSKPTLRMVVTRINRLEATNGWVGGWPMRFVPKNTTIKRLRIGWLMALTGYFIFINRLINDIN